MKESLQILELDDKQVGEQSAGYVETQPQPFDLTLEIRSTVFPNP
jgi:hypothetical protein